MDKKDPLLIVENGNGTRVGGKRQKRVEGCASSRLDVGQILQPMLKVEAGEESY